MAEIHPFGNFIPKNCKYLFLGSFTGKNVEGYDWFYGNKRNQFWSIMQKVFKRELSTKSAKQALFKDLEMAITDTILSCERENNSNLDKNLKNIVLNIEAVNKIIFENQIKTIYFSSRFAEKLFKKYFKNIILKFTNLNFITLPSPSPRYAAMSKLGKIARYKELLPRL